MDRTAIDFSLGLTGNRINQNINGFGLSEFNSNMGGFLEKILKVGVSSAKTTIAVEVKKDIKLDKSYR